MLVPDLPARGLFCQTGGKHKVSGCAPRQVAVLHGWFLIYNFARFVAYLLDWSASILSFLYYVQKSKSEILPRDCWRSTVSFNEVSGLSITN
jgi:hypothetical protein